MNESIPFDRLSLAVVATTFGIVIPNLNAELMSEMFA